MSEKRELRDELSKAVEDGARLKSRLENVREYLHQELEAPLSSIIGMAGLLRESALSGEQAEYVRFIRDAAEGMQLALRSLEDAFPGDASSKVGDEGDFDLRLLIHDLIELFSGHARRVNIRFESEVEDEVPSPVRGIPGILRRVTGSFLRAALTAPSGSTVRLALGLAQSAGSQTAVRLQVEVNALLTGTEQVLELCRDLAQRQGGEVGFDAVDGMTRFRATFVLKQLQTRPAAFPAPCSISGSRILIADPDGSWQELLKEYCYLWGCEHVVVDEPLQVLPELRRAVDQGRAYDFVLLDVHPDMTHTLSLARDVRQDKTLQQTLLVVVASSARPGDARIMEEAEIDGYLVRPVEQRPLYDVLALALSGRRAGMRMPLVTRHVTAEEQKRRKLVLVVDDDETNRKVMTLMLNQGGYASETAASGEAALAMLERTPYALVFMDIQMAGMSGFEAVRLIRQAETALDRSLPVIALTGHAADVEKPRFTAAGFTDVLAKPVDLKLLFRLLDTYMHADDRRHGEEAASLDVKSLLAQLDQDRELLAEVVQTFVREARVRCGEYRQAVEARDFVPAEEKAHALRGMAGNIRAEETRVLAEMAEQLCRRAQRDKALAISREIEAALRRVEQIATQM
jgi:CheY-like chemotaxis protein